LSSSEALETTPDPEAVAAAGGEHRALEADDHGHSHGGPTLNPDCTREVEVEVPEDEVTRSFRTIIKRYQKLARIPGFRSGKVPEALIRSRFAEKIRQDVMEEVLPAHFRSIIAKENLRPVSQPQVSKVELEEGKPLHFKAAFEVVPEFSIEGYQQVKVEKPETALTDAEFESELERIRDSRAVMEPVEEDRALADGDFAEINFTGSMQARDHASPAPEDQTPADQTPEHQAQDEPIAGNDVIIEVGGKNTLESFTAALRGSKAGQELKFEASYPQDFGERRLAGKTVAYDVEIKGIKRKTLPELDDAFAKELGPYESFADFSGQLREHLANDKRRRVESETRNRLVDALAARYNFAVPESLVQQQIDVRLDRGLRALASQGMRTEDMRKLDFDRLRAAQRDLAVAEVKGSLLLDRIADAEQVEVKPDEVDRELESISIETREPLDGLRKRLTENGGLARIREQLRRQKVGSLLYERLAS
jgi:trigger factor